MRAISAAILAVFAVSAFPASLLAQGKSGPQSVDACRVLNQARLEEALGTKVRAQKVPPSTPASLGVSVCMWATPDGRRSLSVTTYGPQAVAHTRAGTIETYYESLKIANANRVHKPAKVLPGIKRKACTFPSESAQGDTILLLRSDAMVTMNVTGLSQEQIAAVAKAASLPLTN
jgi:hypothetical protein